MKQMTCPRSPNHDRFLERVKIEADAFYVLDANFKPFEVTSPEIVRVTHRTTERQCATCGATPFVRLPAFAR